MISLQIGPLLKKKRDMPTLKEGNPCQKNMTQKRKKVKGSHVHEKKIIKQRGSFKKEYSTTIHLSTHVHILILSV